MNEARKIVTSKNGRTEDLLLRYPNFVAKTPAASFALTPIACESSAQQRADRPRRNVFYPESPQPQTDPDRTPFASSRCAACDLPCKD